jgi:hypothetical protein
VNQVSANSFIKYVALVLAAVALTLLTMIFGALPMLLARRAFGRLAYWTGFGAVAAALGLAGLPLYALTFVALTVLVGVYAEIEEYGVSVFVAGTIGVMSATGVVFGGLGLWARLSNLRLGEELRRLLDPFIAQLTQNTTSTVSSEAILQQLPSAIVIMLSLALAVALIGERKAQNRSRAEALEGSNKGGDSAEALKAEGLAAFRLPDLTVWLVTVAIAGAFLKHGIPVLETVSLNLLNLLFVLYFFQGLAVISHAFRVFKIGPVWQAIWYVLLVLQLFLMVSVLGFADYWLEFRERLSRRPVETNREF